MQSTAPRKHRGQLPGIIVLGVLAAAFSVWSLDHVVKSAGIYLQGAAFLFFMLVLGQRSRLVAYILLPLLLAGWFSYDGLYDVAGFFLQNDSCEHLFTTAIFHQHYLRQTYDISVIGTLVILLKSGILYGAIYSTRRFVKPIVFCNAEYTWIIAGGITSLTLILLPLGIIPH